MAYGNNRAGTQRRAHFQLAGGSIIKFKHPYLAGQIDKNSNLDEIDISACCKLEDTYFEATPNQDSAKQVVMIDGSTATISNRLLNGTITLPIIRTTGLVGTGDFISACQLIRSVGDSVGGILYKTDFINGKAITKLYYGVTVQSCPDDVSEGNDVAVYNVRLLYAGWIESVAVTTDQNLKNIWAVGNEQGLSAYFTPYGIQEGSTGSDILSTTNTKVPELSINDSTKDNYDTSDEYKELKENNNSTGYNTYVDVVGQLPSSSGNG